jgi:hypothetical protein
MSKRGFWDHYPKKNWVEADWQAWEKAGRPKVPSHLELQPPPARELGNSPVIPPPGPTSAMTTLFPKPRGKRRGARSDAIDALLDDLGVPSRRRGRSTRW